MSIDITRIQALLDADFNDAVKVDLVIEAILNRKRKRRVVSDASILRAITVLINAKNTDTQDE